MPNPLDTAIGKLRNTDAAERELAPARGAAFDFLIELADRVERSATVLLEGKKLTTREMVLVELALRDYAKRFR